ncbi:MAG: hypothetical protein HY287_05895 [Planctomycetes bacterium]|nr:hypothetical protein [Planctomycetota bacterium]MBI3833844.1 hypothetical protein [Planctomycetota bacterium]
MRRAYLTFRERILNRGIATGVMAFVFVIWSAVHGVPPDNSIRGRDPDASRVQRLATGDAERIGNVVAGTGATLKFYFTPRPPLPGTDPSLPYPSGYTISGQKLTVSRGGFTSAWILQIEGWDPDQNGQPLLRTFQDKIDAAGFLGSNAVPANSGCDLVYPAINSFPCQKTCVGGSNNGGNCTNSSNCPKTCAGGTNNGLSCTSNANCPGGVCSGSCSVDPCPAMLGESGIICGGVAFGVCVWGWQDFTRNDWVFATITSVNFTTGKGLVSPSGPVFGGTTDPTYEIFDSGGKFYTGSLILPVPACCKGVYTMGHVVAETFAQDQAQPANDIPIAALIPGQLECNVDPCTSVTCNAPNDCTTPEYLGPECLKNRFITVSPTDNGGQSALRVTLDSLQHPQPSNFAQFPPPDFSAFEGQARWVGPVFDCTETEMPRTTFKCAFLQCTPFYTNWTTLLAGNWLHITGAEIMPSSDYTIDQLNSSCQGNEQNCTDIARTEQVKTSRYGDCIPNYQNPTAPFPPVQPNVSDQAAIIDKFKSVSSAISRTRAQLQPSIIGMSQPVTISDVASVVDAFRGLAYAQMGPQQCP